jgi:hypothetical protein
MDRYAQQTPGVQNEPFKEWPLEDHGENATHFGMLALARKSLQTLALDQLDIDSETANEARLKLEDEGSPQKLLIRCKERTV